MGVGCSKLHMSFFLIRGMSVYSVLYLYGDGVSWGARVDVGGRAWTLGGGARGRWGRAWTWRGGRSGVSMVGVSMLIGEVNFSANYWYSQTPLHGSSYRYTPPSYG